MSLLNKVIAYEKAIGKSVQPLRDMANTLHPQTEPVSHQVVEHIRDAPSAACTNFESLNKLLKLLHKKRIISYGLQK